MKANDRQKKVNLVPIYDNELEILEYETEITEVYSFPDGIDIMDEFYNDLMASEGIDEFYRRDNLYYWIGIEDWITFTIADECRRMQISTEVPAFYFSSSKALDLENENKEAVSGLKKKIPSYIKKLGGMMHCRTNEMFLNLDNLRTRLDIRETIIHELVHKKFFSLRHGKKFDKMVGYACCGDYNLVNSKAEEILFWREGNCGWYPERVAAIGPYEKKEYSQRWLVHYYGGERVDQGWLRSKIVPIGFYEMMNIRNPGYLYLSW